MNAEDILIVDDEEDIRNLIQAILQDEGYQTRLAARADEAYDTIEKRPPALVILDIWLQGSKHDGLEILQNVKKDHPHMPVIMISGHGTIETAVSAIKQGAYDFIEKPFKSDRLLLMIRRALEAAELRRENEALRRKNMPVDMDLIGTSSACQTLKQVLERVAKTNSRVLLTGEPGSGKEIAARTIHKLSERAHKPFLILNCATMRPERLEIELFGATREIEGEAKTGLLEQAHGGTLLLDEVADMPLKTQGKIVRVLQEQKFQKIGADSFSETDIRILASTNRNLEQAVKQGDFREDLFYRLNVVPINMPTLRERADDIPELARHFIQMLHETGGLPLRRFTDDALMVMKAYKWPGNVRQLKNVLEWTLIMNAGQTGDEIDKDGLPPEISPRAVNKNDPAGVTDITDYTNLSLKEARDAFEKQYLDAQVKRFDGNISKTAEFVGMERSALHRKIKSLQMAVSDKTEEESQANTRKRA